ncbi:predicted protein [Verticillium alfalfae VaMs.102]|uniref:Predicted protein n=1 Tax=Verticillium alfalfae (strain VaMs.102 / ATCC MYA-4576 / FGSC 10136) TaxID=526221 RepID=C9SKI2_VERA1|nr:predicted protein [Verticillium alfalfae VaMs.102]EEY19200.1 predicted protein [Verticillium alfalfae VaMs.102]
MSNQCEIVAASNPAPVKSKDEAWIQGPGNARVGPPSAFMQPGHMMAPIKKTYPRATAKKILKAHSNCNATKNLDVLSVERGSNRLQGLWRKNNYADERAEGDRRCASQVQELREAAFLLPIINMAPNLTIMTSRHAATTSYTTPTTE